MRLSFLIMFLFVTFTSFTQTVTINKTKRAGFQMDSTLHIVVGEMITIGSKDYQVYETSTGSPYIRSMGKNGFYPCWIGSVHDTYVDANGDAIRLSKSGKVVTPYVKANGWPHVEYNSFTVNK